MSAKSRIAQKVTEVYGDNSPNVYKGTDYSGAIQATGWWYRAFGQTSTWLGRSEAEALEILDQVVQERADTRP